MSHDGKVIRNDMLIHSMKVFATVARNESISAAAAEMFLSQPAVTQLIRRMEAELGFMLIDHSQRGKVHLTHAGEEFARYAQQAVSDYEQTLNKCAWIAAGKPYSIKAALKFNDLNLLHYSTIDEFRALYPDIPLNALFSEDRLLEQLYAREYDMVFTDLPSDLPEEYTFVHCVNDRPGCVVMKAHPLARKEKLVLDDLKGQDVYILRLPHTEEPERLAAFLHEVLPALAINMTDDRSLPYQPNFKGIMLMDLADKDRYHFASVIPLELDFGFRKGYVFPKDAHEAVYTFAKLNIQA